MWHLHKLPGPANAFLSRLALEITIIVPCLPLRASRPPSKSPPDSFLQPPLRASHPPSKSPPDSFLQPPLRASRPPSKSPPDSFLQPPLTILRMKLSDVLT